MHIIQGVPLSVALETSQVLSSSPDCHSPRPARAAQSVPGTHPCSEAPVCLRAEVGAAVGAGADAASGLCRADPAL